MIEFILAITVAVASNWIVKPTSDKDTMHLVNRVTNGALHAVCKKAKCVMFVEPRTGCKLGTRYPMLINSETVMGVLAGRCVVVRNDGVPIVLVRIDDAHSLTQLMIADANISLGFPTQSGPINVIDIKTKGFAAALKIDAPSDYQT